MILLDPLARPVIAHRGNRAHAPENTLPALLEAVERGADALARPVIAHRGNRAHAPENTLPALLEAVARGADALEFDLRVSRDGQLVLFHDPTLERTTDGRGAVARPTAGAAFRGAAAACACRPSTRPSRRCHASCR